MLLSDFLKWTCPFAATFSTPIDTGLTFFGPVYPPTITVSVTTFLGTIHGVAFSTSAPLKAEVESFLNSEIDNTAVKLMAKSIRRDKANDVHGKEVILYRLH